MSLSLYPIIKKIGEGGFSTTYLATNTLMPSQPYCVVKQLTPTSTDPQVQQLIKERFKQEAITLENLGRESNGTIPSLYAYFSEQGEFYLIQEYIDGQTLNERVQTQGLFTETQIRQLLIDILPILAYVHQRGIVHRDIKPENIMLCHRNNKPMLIDFGAVKETMSTMRSAAGNTTKSIVIGTPGFMAIEQMSGRPMFASDIYALGLTAIYLLTGKLPAEIETDPGSVNVNWQLLAPNISPQLIEVLNKAIQPSLRDRYKNAQEMLQDLNSLLPPFTPSSTIASPIFNSYEKTMYIPATTVSNVSRQGNPLIAAILAVSIGGGLIGGFLVLGQNSGIKESSQNKNNSKRNVTKDNDIAARTNPNIINNSTAATERHNLSNIKNKSIDPPNIINNSTAATERHNLSSSKNISIDPPNIINNPTAATERHNLSSSKNTSSNTYQDPREPVRDYYSNIHRKNYSSAWNSLPVDLQNNKSIHPDGYNSFLEWWSKQVTDVEIQQTNLVSQTERDAVVDVEIEYRLRKGRAAPRMIRYFLVKDARTHDWIIQKIRLR